MRTVEKAMSKEIELKPCPFCGGEAGFISESSSIKCKRCGCAFIVTNPLISRMETAQAWNRRERNECELCDEG